MKNSVDGFGLIEVLIGLVLGSILALAIATISSQGFKAARGVEQTAEASQFGTELVFGLKNPETCALNLSAPTRFSTLRFDSSALSTASIPVNTLVSGTALAPVILASSGSPIPNYPRLLSRTIEVKGIYDVSPVANPKTRYIARLEFEFEKLGESLGSVTMNRKFPISLTTTDVGGGIVEITGCSMMGGSTSLVGSLTTADLTYICEEMGGVWAPGPPGKCKLRPPLGDYRTFTLGALSPTGGYSRSRPTDIPPCGSTSIGGSIISGFSGAPCARTGAGAHCYGEESGMYHIMKCAGDVVGSGSISASGDGETSGAADGM